MPPSPESTDVLERLVAELHRPSQPTASEQTMQLLKAMAAQQQAAAKPSRCMCVLGWLCCPCKYACILTCSVLALGTVLLLAARVITGSFMLPAQRSVGGTCPNPPHMFT